MSVHQIKKVNNGWVAFDEFGDVIDIASTKEQLAEILDISENDVRKDGEIQQIYLDVNPNFNFDYFWSEIKRENKVQAIRTFRRAFTDRNNVDVVIGLKASKDFVEEIIRMVNIPRS